MKKILFLQPFYMVFLLFMMSDAALGADQPVTVYADSNYPPYSYEEKGEVKGIYTDIVREVFFRMKGYQVTIIALPWKRGLSMLAHGTGFAIYPPYKRPLERPYIAPYSEPILDEVYTCFCRDSVLASPRPVWPSDYAGLRVGLNLGFLVPDLNDAVNKYGIQIDEGRDNETNLKKMSRNRIDCYINDRHAILWEIGKRNLQGFREGAQVSLEQGHLGYTSRDAGRFPFREDFIKQFDLIIKEMKNSGDIRNIVNSFLDRQVRTAP